MRLEKEAPACSHSFTGFFHLFLVLFNSWTQTFPNYIKCITFIFTQMCKDIGSKFCINHVLINNMIVCLLKFLLNHFLIENFLFIIHGWFLSIAFRDFLKRVFRMFFLISEVIIIFIILKYNFNLFFSFFFFILLFC